MKLWASPVEACVFCEFRALQLLHRRLSIRTFHIGLPQGRDRPAERAQRQRSKTDGGGTRLGYLRDVRQDDRGKGQISFANVGTYGVSRPRGIGAYRAHLLQAAEKALPKVKIRLKASVTDDPAVSQFDVLDPGGAQWPLFVEEMRLLLHKMRSGHRTMTAVQLRLRTRLEEAMSAGGKVAIGGEIGKILHFAFVDHVLQQRQERAPDTVSHFADLRYPTEWYTAARAQQRDIHLHVGPTNSGKTYNALKRLEESKHGFYAGPLRLLAHEVFSRFKAKGIPCDLVTGDDVRRDEDPEVRMYASTVEMVDTTKEVEVAVIDEIQMMASRDRGWAWTRAFLGANAKEVHLCGETRVVPLIKELAASMGDTLHIHNYDRLSPLKAMSRSLRGNLKNLRKGDCVVSFTIMNIHALKKQIELDTGRRVAIVYGSLPPETRARQAELFNDPNNEYDFLVASNAIGMGLNLAIKRIVFESVMRFNGTYREKLSIADVKQIAGRAGRYRTAFQVSQADKVNPADVRATQYHATTSVGLVTCLDEGDLAFIQEALESEPEPIKAAGILPPAQYVDEYAARLPKGLPFEYILRRICEVSMLHPRYMLCDIKDQLGIVQCIERVDHLSILQRCTIAASPADPRSREGKKVLFAFARLIAEEKPVTVADIPEIPLEVLEMPMSGQRDYLLGLEQLHKALILFLWLSYRYVSIFADQDMAIHAKELVEEKINTTLLEFSANPKLRQRLLEMRLAGEQASKDLESDKHHSEGSASQADILHTEGSLRKAIAAPLLPSQEAKSADGYDESSALPIDWGTRGGENAEGPSAAGLEQQPKAASVNG